MMRRLRDIAQDLVYRLEAWGFDRVARFSAASSEAQRHRLAELLTWIAHDLLAIRRSYVREAMRGHLPASAGDPVVLCRKAYHSIFANLLTMAGAGYQTIEQLFDGLEIVGREHLDAARAGGRGTILACAHYGYWELTHHWMNANGIRLTSVARIQKNPYVDHWLTASRCAHGGRIIDSGYALRDIIRTLRSGEMLGLMSDHNAGDRGLFVEFLGEAASTVIGPSQLAQKTGAWILPAAMHVRRHRPPVLQFYPPIDPAAYPDGHEGRLAMTRRLNDIFSDWIRARPDQWFWLHRRWKSRPSPLNEPAPKEASR